MTTEPDDKELNHSEEVQEIIGTIPSWIIRWGVTAIAAIFALIVVGCCIIKYPQTILSTISIISVNPPSQLSVKHSGVIDTITVINGQSIKQGEPIVLLKSAALFKDVMAVKSFADSSQLYSLSEDVSLSILERTLVLGELQERWTALRSVLREYQMFRRLNLIEKEKVLLNEQIEKNKEYYNALLNQKELLERDVQQKKHIAKKDSLLCVKGLIGQLEYESSQRTYLSILNRLVSFEKTLKDVGSNELILEQEYNKLDRERQGKEDAYNLEYSQIIATLLSQIDDWIEQYTIIAPFDGIVTLQDRWERGQHVNVGDIMANVAPAPGSLIEGRMKVPSAGFGRVAKGQTVNVRLNSFPYIEYGILKGEIVRISQTPEKGIDGSIAYNVVVSFPQGLVSTYHKTIPFMPEMDGNAEIVTRDRRLIEYFIDPITSLLRNK